MSSNISDTSTLKVVIVTVLSLSLKLNIPAFVVDETLENTVFL